MQIGKKEGMPIINKKVVRFGIAIAATGMATATLFSLTVQQLNRSFSTGEVRTIETTTNVDTVIRVSAKSTVESPETLFANIPEEEKEIESATLNPAAAAIAATEGAWPTAEYSLFNFKNDATWDSEPTMGKGEKYPGLDKNCDSTKVSTQGICGPATSLQFAMPVKDPKISSFFGWRKVYGRTHYGIDFADVKGTPILASERGTVTNWTTGKNSGSFGIYVELNHGNSFTTLYAHMSKVAVKAGDHVEKGDIIGYIGSTGATNANHLHFEIRHKGIPYNPFLGYMELPASYASEEPEPEDIFLEIPDEI